MPAPRRPASRPAVASLAVIRKRRDQVAKICERFPQTEATNRYDNEHRSLEVAGKRFGYFLVDHFGDDGRSGLALKAAPGVQETLVEEDPDTFWVPAFVGRHGWLGVRLDLEEPDWEQVAEFIQDAWMLTAPKKVRQAAEGG